MENKNLKEKTKWRGWKWVLWISGGIFVLGLAAGVVWATYARPPLPDALQALESDGEVEVELEPWLIFNPAGQEDSGLIFYPGGRIDPRGYADLMREIANEGYLVVVPSMPINMAIFDTDAANEIMEAFPGIKNWAIAGHSVGGTSAAIYTFNHPDQIDGLLIWASFPADSSDLSGAALPVTLIYGELDPRVDRTAVEARKRLLPPQTVYLEIEGGDHHQFGTYQTREGVDQSTISRVDQQRQIIQATLDLLDLIAQ